jgi:hypothetical protein
MMRCTHIVVLIAVTLLGAEPANSCIARGREFRAEQAARRTAPPVIDSVTASPLDCGGSYIVQLHGDFGGCTHCGYQLSSSSRWFRTLSATEVNVLSSPFPSPFVVVYEIDGTGEVRMYGPYLLTVRGFMTTGARGH